MKYSLVEMERLLEATESATRPASKFTPLAAYKPSLIQVDDVLMAILVLALMAWML